MLATVQVEETTGRCCPITRGTTRSTSRTNGHRDRDVVKDVYADSRSFGGDVYLQHGALIEDKGLREYKYSLCYVIRPPGLAKLMICSPNKLVCQ